MTAIVLLMCPRGEPLHVEHDRPISFTRGRLISDKFYRPNLSWGKMNDNKVVTRKKNEAYNNEVTAIIT